MRRWCYCSVSKDYSETAGEGQNWYVVKAGEKDGRSQTQKELSERHTYNYPGSARRTEAHDRTAGNGGHSDRHTGKL